VPVTSVASGDTTVLNYLELLGVESTLRVLDMRFVTSPCLMRLAECGAITHVSTASVDYEVSDAWLAATSGVELVLTDSWGTGATGSGRDVDVDASFDPGILNRGEWIKFVSLFFNAEARANAYFSGVMANVSAVGASGAASASASGAARPIVAFAAYDSWSSAWQLSNATYKAQYVAGAGGALAAMPAPGGAVSYTNWTSPATTANFADTAALHAALRGVAVLIDETLIYPASPETYTYASFLAAFNFTAADAASGVYPFLTNGAVYREDRIINDGIYGFFGTDWFANAVAQPQAALADFYAALFPPASAPASSASAAPTTWLRNLARDAPFVVRESAQCADPGIAPLCGGPSTTLTLPRLAPAAFSAAALHAAVLAALPAGATATVTVTDFLITTTLTLVGAPDLLTAAGGAAALLGALGTSLGYPLTATSPVVSTPVSGRRRTLLAAAPSSSSVALPVMIDSFGMAGAPAAADMLALLSNTTALLATARAAGVTGVTAAAAAGTSVAATVSVTVKGANADAGLAALTAAAQDGSLNAALVSAGLAVQPPPSSGAARGRGAIVAAVVATAAAALLACA
jgi:hypothetical protein